MKTYTLTECQQLLALTPKQLRRLLVDASIVPAKASIDGRKQLLTEEQVSQLSGLWALEAAPRASALVAENSLIARLEARLVVLERRVTQLEGRRVSMSSLPAVEGPVMRTSYGVQLPTGWVSAVPFLVEHLRCSETTARRRVLQLSHHAGEWAGGVRYAFDEEQQRQVLDLMQLSST